MQDLDIGAGAYELALVVHCLPSDFRVIVCICCTLRWNGFSTSPQNLCAEGCMHSCVRCVPCLVHAALATTTLHKA